MILHLLRIITFMEVVHCWSQLHGLEFQIIQYTMQEIIVFTCFILLKRNPLNCFYSMGCVKENDILYLSATITSNL